MSTADVNRKPIDISVFDNLVSVLYDNGSVVSFAVLPHPLVGHPEIGYPFVLKPLVTNP